MSGARKPRVWDGRGDRLRDARFSMMPGRAADDLRLTAVHLRILCHTARQNSQRGWLRLSQTELATAWQLHRGSINRAVGELVEWAYLDKQDQATTGESFCLYRLRIDTDGDEDIPAATAAVAEGGVSHVDDTPHGAADVPSCMGGVSHAGDRSVTSTSTPVSPHKTHYRYPPTGAETSPPLPPAATKGGGRVRDWLDELEDEDVAPAVVRELLRPLIAAGLKPWADAEPITVGRQVCRDLARETIPVIEALRELVLDEQRYRLPPVAKLRELLVRSREKADEAERTRRAISDLAPVDALADETRRFLDLARELVPPERFRAWFQDMAVVSIGPRVARIVSPFPSQVTAQACDQLARIAIRDIAGGDRVIEFIRGRPVFSPPVFPKEAAE